MTTPTNAKFSNFVDGGNLQDNDIVVGLRSGVNTRFNFQLNGVFATISNVQNQGYNYATDTGTTNAYVIALNPSISSYVNGQFFGMTAINTNTGASTLNAGAGAVSIFNNDGSTIGANSILALGSYEFIYNSNFGGFVLLNSSLDISGTGTVNPGLQNQLAWYASNGNAVSGLATSNNGLLVTSNSGVPSIGTLGQGLQVISSSLKVGATNNIPFNDGKGIIDGNGNPILLFSTISSAVNYVNVTDAATNNSPIISALGADSNISLELVGKGNGGVNVQGATNNMPIAVGFKGEVISSFINQGSSVSLTSGIDANVTLISPTAGAWMIWGVIYPDVGSMTQTVSMLGQISANNGTVTFPPIANTPTAGASNNPANPTQGFFLSITPVIVYLSATTPYYLNATATFSVSTLKVYGGIWAMRL